MVSFGPYECVCVWVLYNLQALLLVDVSMSALRATSCLDLWSGVSTSKSDRRVTIITCKSFVTPGKRPWHSIVLFFVNYLFLYFP